MVLFNVIAGSPSFQFVLEPGFLLARPLEADDREQHTSGADQPGPEVPEQSGNEAHRGGKSVAVAIRGWALSSAVGFSFGIRHTAKAPSVPMTPSTTA